MYYTTVFHIVTLELDERKLFTVTSVSVKGLGGKGVPLPPSVKSLHGERRSGLAVLTLHFEDLADNEVILLLGCHALFSTALSLFKALTADTGNLHLPPTNTTLTTHTRLLDYMSIIPRIMAEKHEN
jgi:hypothetical protein